MNGENNQISFGQIRFNTVSSCVALNPSGYCRCWLSMQMCGLFVHACPAFMVTNTQDWDKINLTVITSLLKARLRRELGSNSREMCSEPGYGSNKIVVEQASSRARGWRSP